MIQRKLGCEAIKTMRAERQKGFTLVELIVVVAVIGMLVAIVIPALLTAVDRSRQRRSMADMANLAKANGMQQVDTGRYVAALVNLSPDYLMNVPSEDAWGNAWSYTLAANQLSYELRSFGKDGANGPAAPVPWFNEPYEPDIVMTTGQFTQMPTSQ